MGYCVELPWATVNNNCYYHRGTECTEGTENNGTTA